MTAVRKLFFAALAVVVGAAFSCKQSPQTTPTLQQPIPATIRSLVSQAPSQVVDLDGASEREVALEVLVDSSNTTSVDLSSLAIVDNRIYLTDRASNRILIANLDGTGPLILRPNSLPSNGLLKPEGIAAHDSVIAIYDSESQKLWFLNLSLNVKSTLPLPFLRDNVLSGQSFDFNYEFVFVGAGEGQNHSLNVFTADASHNFVGALFPFKDSTDRFLKDEVLLASSPHEQSVYFAFTTSPVLFILDDRGNLIKTLTFQGKPTEEYTKSLPGVRVITIPSVATSNARIVMRNWFFHGISAAGDGVIYFITRSVIFELRFATGEYVATRALRVTAPSTIDQQLPLYRWITSIKGHYMYVLLSGKNIVFRVPLQ
jgi:hypothetical protein